MLCQICKHQIELLKLKICDLDEKCNRKTDKVVKWDIYLNCLTQFSLSVFQLIQQDKINAIKGVIL